MNEKGFTLIEIIVGIMLIAIVASILISSSSQWPHASTPLNTISDNYAVAQAIEIVNADYRNRLSNGSATDDNVITDYNAHKADLSGVITNLPSSVTVTGEITTFSEKSTGSKTMIKGGGSINYFLVSAQKNNSRMVTLIGI